MKLSEVIKAIEDGSRSNFRCGNIVIKSMYNAIEVLSGKWKVDDNDFNNLVWEEVKPPRQWSEKELMFFKLLPDWAKWIATDDDGTTCIFPHKPKNERGTFINFDKNVYEVVNLFDFLTITFEESPVYIGDLKGE